MKILVLITILTAAAPAFSQNESFTIAAIDFYGHTNVNLDQLRAKLPLRVGDSFSPDSKEKTVDEFKQAIKQATGREPTDIAPVCCDDRGRVTIYVGLRGESASLTLYNAAPRGSARLPRAALKVHRTAERAWLKAMEKENCVSHFAHRHVVVAHPFELV